MDNAEPLCGSRHNFFCPLLFSSISAWIQLRFQGSERPSLNARLYARATASVPYRLHCAGKLSSPTGQRREVPIAEHAEEALDQLRESADFG